MNYLIVDAYFAGTGIRDEYNGKYIQPQDIGISERLTTEINIWLCLYKKESHNGYRNTVLIEKLDKEGLRIALKIKKELRDVKISYWSDAKMEKYLL